MLSTSPQSQIPTLAALETKVGRDWIAFYNKSIDSIVHAGFEGLTLSPDGQTLYALLQSATIQDGGSDKSTSRYTRLLAFDVSVPLLIRPPVIGEWVVPLPQSGKGNTLAASELHYVSEGIFLALSRDGDGHGGDDDHSSYKYVIIVFVTLRATRHTHTLLGEIRQADLVDISGATDIHGTKFDNRSNPISPNGVLDESIKPAEYVGFVNFINDTQLARFGVHNGKELCLLILYVDLLIYLRTVHRQAS